MTLMLPACQAEARVCDAAPRTSILLVDDDSPVLAAMKEMLEEIGLPVTACRSGRDAVAAYRERTDDYALVIVDMVMPDLSGSETMTALKRIRADAPVLMMSASASEAEVQTTLRQGALGFLAKPFSHPELAEKIQSILASLTPVRATP